MAFATQISKLVLNCQRHRLIIDVLITIYLDGACKIDMMYNCNALIYSISIQHLFSIAIDIN